MRIEFAERSLPILMECEILVVGGSFAGLGAALELAQAGCSVALVEPRTYLGREITANMRPWLVRGDSPHDELIEGLIQAAGVPTLSSKLVIPLHLDRVKLYLEDQVLASGIQLLYASLPVGLLRGTEQRGLIIGNKSGRQVIIWQTMIDATETAVAARVAGAEFELEPVGPTCWRRTLEFDQVQPLDAAKLSVPEALQVHGNTVTLRPGWTEDDVLVECEYEFVSTGTGLAGLNEREIQARYRSIALASHLILNVPAFARARFGTASNDLYGAYSTPMTGGAPAWAANSGTVTLPTPDFSNSPVAASLFATPEPRVWVLNQAARLERDMAALFEEPATACRLGRALGAAVLRNQGQPSQIGSSSAQATSPAAIEAGLVLEVQELDSPQRGKPFKRHLVPAQVVPVLTQAEVIVAGGGSSGATATIAAASEGVKTVLVELNPGLGGTGTYGGVNSYWSGRHVAFTAGNKARVAQIQKTLNMPSTNLWNTQAKMQALLEMAVEAGAELYLNVITIGVLRQDRTVQGVVIATRYGPVALTATVVVDATGDADLAAFAGADFVYGSARDHTVMWYSLNQLKRPGRTQGNFTAMADVSNVLDYTRAILTGRRRGGQALYDHGIYVAPRESRHIIGEVVLTLADLLLQRSWEDVVNIHFSNYDIKGKCSADWCLMGIIPPNLDMEIPYRVLLPRGLSGLLVSGKAFSATHDALPGTRMQADIENLGGVTGLAAALAVRTGISPHLLDVRQLQERLVQIGLLPPEVLTRSLAPRSHADGDIIRLIGAIDAERPLHSLSDTKLTETFRGLIPEVELLTLGKRAIPHLERAHNAAQGERRVRLAQLLCFLEDPAGVPTLVARIASELHAREELPPRESFIRNANLPPPDQGAMPDLVYLTYSLGMARDPRALAVVQQMADLLEFGEQDLWDFYKSPFLYVDAICYVAEKLADPAALPILRKIHSHPLLHGQVMHLGFQPDYMAERLGLLELALARAMARCGSPEGYVILINYLDDARALYAEQAHAELVAISGEDYGKSKTAWSNWLEEEVDNLPLRPVVERLDMPEEDDIIMRPEGFLERLRQPFRFEPHPEFSKEMLPIDTAERRVPRPAR